MSETDIIPKNTTFLRTTPSEEPGQRPSYYYSPLHQSLTTQPDESDVYMSVTWPLLEELNSRQPPGAIIETEEQRILKARILDELDNDRFNVTNRKRRQYSPEEQQWLREAHGAHTFVASLDGASDVLSNDINTSEEDRSKEDADVKDNESEFDDETLGTWTIEDIRSKFDYEWDPNGPDLDPNIVSLNQPGTRYVEVTPLDPEDPSVELHYDPIFGPSSPIDRRTILGAQESFMVNPKTRDESRLQPQFASLDDPEIQFNQDVVDLRKSMDIIETYVDPFLPDMEIPRHVAKWHGYPEQVFLEPKPFTNNRFTRDADRTDFDQMDPFRARQRAVELARSKNAEWMLGSVSHKYHAQQRAPYETYATNVGTLRPQSEPFSADLMEQIKPALQVFGSCVTLLSINSDTAENCHIYRFHYHGLMKNRHGMKAWMTTLLRDECGVPVTGVIFETGFRARDPAYDGGDPWYAPIS